MVTPNVTAILVGLLVIWMLSRTIYRKQILFVFMLVVIYLALKMCIFRYNRPAQRKTAEEAVSSIEEGDLIHICSVKDAVPFIDPFTLVCMFSNEEQIHTAYVVKHQSKLYVLNSYANFLFHPRRSSYKDPDSAIVLESNHMLTIFMEPLEEFLRTESNLNSYIKIVRTEKKPRAFDMSQKKLFKELADKWWNIHCCKVIGKYLESQGLSENRSGYSDFLYYFPDVLRKNLKQKDEILIQLV